MAKLRVIDDLPPRLYAVGDVHGCAAELEVLLAFMRSHEAIAEQDIVIFVGDYIDRGPDSKSVIEMLLAFQKEFPDTVFLKGNHEDMMLEYLGYDGTLGASYLVNGGAQTLKSYGLSPQHMPAEVLEQLPARHISFLLNLESYVAVDEFVFVHAGLSPLRALESQLNQDLFWIREEFINNIHHFKKTVVFGHTPYENVMFNLPYKIGIDTGCVYGNMLSCIEVIGGTILQVERGKKEVAKSTFEAHGVVAG